MKSILYFILIPALLPVFIILRYVYVLDRNEREPLGFVLKIVILGALFSIPCAGIENFMESILSSIYDTATIEYAWMENVFGVALVEELAKWLVLMIFVWKNKNFDFDAIDKISISVFSNGEACDVKTAIDYVVITKKRPLFGVYKN